MQIYRGKIFLSKTEQNCRWAKGEEKIYSFNEIKTKESNEGNRDLKMGR